VALRRLSTGAGEKRTKERKGRGEEEEGTKARRKSGESDGDEY